MNEVFIAIDTSHTAGVLVVFHQEKGILFEAIANEKMSHGKNLPLFFQDALEFIERNNFSLAAVGLGLGPGSFVGIRISLSFALGFCLARNVPLMGFCSHRALRHSVILTEDVGFLMKASGDLVYFSKPDEEQKIQVLHIEEINVEDYQTIYTDVPTVKGESLFGPTPAGLQKAFTERLNKTGIVDESDVIKPNYLKNPSISLKKPIVSTDKPQA